MSNGHELNGETIGSFRTSSDHDVFVFLPTDTDFTFPREKRAQDDFSSSAHLSLPLPPLSPPPTLAPTAIELVEPSFSPLPSTSSSLDEQLGRLTERLVAIELFLKKCSSLLADCNRCHADYAKRAMILRHSAEAAEANFELHLRAAEDDVQTTMHVAGRELSTISALLNRCPMDFALLKRIPLRSQLLAEKVDAARSTSTTSAFLSLLDCKREIWQSKYAESSALKEKATAIMDQLTSAMQNVRLSGGSDGDRKNQQQHHLRQQHQQHEQSTLGDLQHTLRSLGEEIVASLHSTYLIDQDHDGALLTLLLVC
jgi:hypothetical protein